MSVHATTAQRGFYRNADRALLGGVCAGLADYFGFNLRATRLLTFIAFLMAMPMTVLAYLAAVFLVPARSTRMDKAADPDFRQTLRSSPARAADDVRRRFQALDRRLARMEKYITSSRYELDREFRQL
ncbi:MAG: PspC domain-containing protein [Gammaproteobacteria bacterium]|nr:PspC domain-containing protein [Gammaproteobacteria bacterium]